MDIGHVLIADIYICGTGDLFIHAEKDIGRIQERAAGCGHFHPVIARGGHRNGGGRFTRVFHR